jgi:very-short-patch-repair endonuclease
MTIAYNKTKLLDHRKHLRSKQTEAEKRLWQHLRNRQMQNYKFYRQYSVGPYIIDFYCPKSKLAIELDGGRHNNTATHDYDTQRTSYLEGYGIKVIRFWNNDVMSNLDGTLVTVTKCLTPPRLLASARRHSSPLVKGRIVTNC